MICGSIQPAFYHDPGTVTGSDDRAVNKTGKYVCPHRPSVLPECTVAAGLSHYTDPRRCRITLYIPSLMELWEIPQPKEQHSAIRHFQSKPQGFP